MNRKELAVASSETTMIDQRVPAPTSGVATGSVCIPHACIPPGYLGVGRVPLPVIGAWDRRPATPGYAALAALTRLSQMRLGRIASPDGVAFVSIEGELDNPAEMIAREIAEHPFGTPNFTGRSWPLADVRLLAPILASKVVCVGKNYADHIAEMGEATGPVPADPVIFLKPNTAIIGPNVPIRLPANASPVHFEGELAVVIGRPCKDVSAAQAAENILGYTIGNDVSARDQQRSDGQWTRAKGHDTFCPVGPWIVTDLNPLDPGDLELRTEVNGEVKQRSRTSLLIHDIGSIVEWISAVMTLLPGDLILTGTPAGVGPIEDGDTVSITIEGIGTLTNPVVRKGKS
ncbi:Ureidoglycolate lyase [Mycobacterium avium subsp. paratuberculosis]|nr:Ureidoglycolate lyase [Mycobacterium avium subsp. paratuberculosis]